MNIEDVVYNYANKQQILETVISNLCLLTELEMLWF